MLAPLLLFIAVNASGQQTYVTRFDQFDGFTYLNSPLVSLEEYGFHTQFGVRVKTWVSLGFDYSVSTGNLTITPNLLVPSLQQSLGAQLEQLIAAGVIPPNYKLVVPASSLSQTFAGGPQIAFRHWQKFTLFVRPSIGLIHETATISLTDPVETAIVEQIVPSGKKTDNTGFYGVGGGIDLLLSRHVGVRIQGDFVRDHLFNDILQDWRNTVRLSIGPCFNFGRNIVRNGKP